MMDYFDKDKNGSIDYNEFIVTLFPVYSKSYKPVAWQLLSEIYSDLSWIDDAPFSLPAHPV